MFGRVVFCLLFATVPLGAMENINLHPMLVMCAERLIRVPYLEGAPEDNDVLLHFRKGVHLLEALEQEGSGASANWPEVESYLLHPILAVEAQVLAAVQGQQDIRVKAEKRLADEIERLRGFFSGPAPSSVGVATAQEVLVRKTQATELFLRIERDPNAQEKIAQLIKEMGSPTTLQALLQSAPALHSLLPAFEFHRLEDLRSLTFTTLLRVLFLFESAYYQFPSEQPRILGALKVMAGGDAQRFLWEIEARRKRHNPNDLYLMNILLLDLPENTTLAYALAQARTFNRRLLLDSRGDVSAHVRGMAQNLHQIPPARVFTEVDVRSLLVMLFLFIDGKTSADADLALDQAYRLIGDPRVHSNSLLEWAQSLLGERRYFKDEPYLRFLQEAASILFKVKTLDPGRQAVIAREYRKNYAEELGPSFDVWVVDGKTRQVVEGMEIKQMPERPFRASELSDALRHATRKFNSPLIPLPDAPFHFPAPKDGSVATLRTIPVRKTLHIQVPWTKEAYTAKRGGVHLVATADGWVEKRRPDGTAIARNDLFEEFATHLANVTDAECFSEIRLLTYQGESIVAFIHESGRWLVSRDK